MNFLAVETLVTSEYRRGEEGQGGQSTRLAYYCQEMRVISLIRKKDNDSEQPSSLVHTATQKAQQTLLKAEKTT